MNIYKHAIHDTIPNNNDNDDSIDFSITLKLKPGHDNDNDVSLNDAMIYIRLLITSNKLVRGHNFGQKRLYTYHGFRKHLVF